MIGLHPSYLSNSVNLPFWNFKFLKILKGQITLAAGEGSYRVSLSDK
jgi:hypothetical protein